MLRWAGLVVLTLFTALVFAGVALTIVLEPLVGLAGAAGFTVLAFLIITALFGWLLHGKVRHAMNWAAERRDRAREAIHHATPGRVPLMAGGGALAAGLIGWRLLRWRRRR